MTIQEEFTEIYQQYIHREGADKFLDYLQNKSDFFTAPASTRFHGSYAGGLAQHSINVYHCLRAYLERQRVKEDYGMEYSDETIALVSLLHDVCKIGCYKAAKRILTAFFVHPVLHEPTILMTRCPMGMEKSLSIFFRALCG